MPISWKCYLPATCSRRLDTGLVDAGMTNGEIFAKVMANSPGGVIADKVQGMPPIFMSAGLQDNIFPINQGGNPV